MLETKCVANNFEMLVTVLTSLSPGSSIFRHQHSKDVIHIEIPSPPPVTCHQHKDVKILFQSQMPPGSSSSSVPQSNPAPPNSLVSHVIRRGRPIGYRAPPTIRSDSDSEQCLTNRRSGSGCSEPPPYPDCISSSSSLIHEPYPRPRPRPCPTPVTDKE